MSKSFIKSILIAAIAVTGISISSASPARAGNDDLAKFLFGATALVIIGKAISDSDSKDVHVHKRVAKPKPKPRYSKALPHRCVRHHRTYDGRVRLMGKRCLENHYRHVNLLPHACHDRVHTYEGVRRGYDLRCLRNKGFYIAS